MRLKKKAQVIKIIQGLATHQKYLRIRNRYKRLFYWALYLCDICNFMLIDFDQSIKLESIIYQNFGLLESERDNFVFIVLQYHNSPSTSMVRNEQLIQNLKASGNASKDFPLHCWSIALINSGTLTSPSYKPRNQAESLFLVLRNLCMEPHAFNMFDIFQNQLLDYYKCS